MSKKTFTMKNKKASKVYKCDGQLLRKIITDKGFMPTELSRMMDYCSDYLNSCTRKNKISDVCVKKLMGYRIFPQMYGVEGEIKVDEPKEVKIDKDELTFLELKLAATNRRIDHLSKVMLSHEDVLIRLMKLYVCDPDKNTKCNKTECYLHGGQCQMTLNKDFERTGECKDADDGK